MSSEKNKKEAIRWYKTALEDIKAGDVLSREKLFARACFHYHQAGEKLLKAVWYFDGDDPWGHSIVKLIREMPRIIHQGQFQKIINLARDLDKYYIPTRYPNGIPEETPEVFYTKEDAGKSKNSVKSIKSITKEILGV